MAQVARIGGQLLQDNLQREASDLAFDTDLLVISTDDTLGIGTTTTPRNLTINGTMRSTSGNSDPDIVFGNSLKVGDITLASSGISTASGNITLKSTHSGGYVTTGGIGSYNFAVKKDTVAGSSASIIALQTNGNIGIRPTKYAGMTAAWNSNGNYGEYWYPGPKDSPSAPDNDCDRLKAEAQALSSGSPTAAQILVFDFTGNGVIEADDVLKIGQLNTAWYNNQKNAALRILSDHANPDKFKEYIEANYPRSVPRKLQLQTGGKLEVNGNIHATGDISYAGDTITLGDDSTDTATFLADFKTSLIPDDSNRFHIGKDDDSTGPQKGFTLFTTDLVTDSMNARGLIYQGIELSKSVGLIFVSTNNGDDTNRGTTPTGPFATITKALSTAVDGDIIYIYPGQYQETFPMTVPKGVTLQGESLRSVEIYPTSATQSKDAFLLRSDSVVENLTIKDFYYSSTDNTGHGFRFASNYTDQIGSPEIGRSPYVRNVTVITQGTTTSASDPRGFASGDAGKGALVDASEVDQGSVSANMLFHAVTFITPGVDGLTIKGGVRVEWLNSFTYFANRGLYMQHSLNQYTPSAGSYNPVTGVMSLTIGSHSMRVGETITITNDSLTFTCAQDSHATDHTYPRSSDPYSGKKVIITEKTATTITCNIGISSNTTAHLFKSASANAVTEGTMNEFRVIASANVYGNKGIEADGNGCLAYLINHNFAYIGSGKNVTNDNTTVIQANEVIKTNNAQVYFTGQDQRGNFRVGDKFLVDVENERTSFDVESIFATNSQVKLKSDAQTITLQSGQINLDNMLLTGNTITTTSSDMNLNAAGSIVLNGNVNIPTVTTTANFSIEGSINTLGDSPTDTVDFNTRLGQDFVPGSTDDLKLGTQASRWKELYGNSANINDVRIQSGQLGTSLTNANLNLKANGTGKVRFENIELDGNSVIGQYSANGLFEVLDSTDGVGPTIFGGFASLKTTLTKYVMCYNIPILAPATVSDIYLLNAASVLASYFDNNFDGVIDNATLYAEFSDGLSGLVVYTDTTEETNLTATLGTFKTLRTTSLYASEMNSALGDGYSSVRDQSLERLLKTYLIPKYNTLYSPLSTTRQNALTDAMDIARGGYQVGGYPGYSYPAFAWYTDPTGLTYQNLVIEYLYLLISSYSGANDWRSSLPTLFDHYTRSALIDNDTSGVSVITTALYALPITNKPSHDYWASVTANLGGTSRDITFAPAANLTMSANQALKLPAGTSVQRPTVTGGLRFNTDTTAFEGVVGTGAVSLEGIISTDRRTKLDLNTNNNQFTFVTNNNSNHILNGTLLESTGFSSDHKFSIDGNIVSSDEADGTSVLRSNGVGWTTIENVHFQDSNLLNYSDSNFAFNLTNSTGYGYLKIENVNGLVPPLGTTGQRPGTPEVGNTRYNTTLEYLETWNGTKWINAAGEVTSIAESDVEELAFVFNLILD